MQASAEPRQAQASLGADHKPNNDDKHINANDNVAFSANGSATSATSTVMSANGAAIKYAGKQDNKSKTNAIESLRRVISGVFRDNHDRQQFINRLMSGVDSHLSVIHRPNRFIDVVDEEWVTHQLPSETLFRNVSEFDDDDDDFAAASVNGAAPDGLDHFAMLGAAAPHVSAAINAPPDDASGAFRWNDLALAPFLASAPQRPQPPTNSRND